MFLTTFYLSELLVKPLKEREVRLQREFWPELQMMDLGSSSAGVRNVKKEHAPKIIIFRCIARIQYLLLAVTSVALWIQVSGLLQIQ